jgi:hypothetical protein
VCGELQAKNTQATSPLSFPGIAKSVDQWVDTAHEEISQNILRTVNRFDGFFGDERVDEELQNTQISLGLVTTFQSNHSPLFTFPLGIKLSLPRLKNRVQLAVDTLLQEQVAGDDIIADKQSQNESHDINVSLRYKIFERMSEWISVDGGVKLNSESISWETLEPFGSLRIRMVSGSEPWALRLTQVAKWEQYAGWQGLTKFDLERYLGEKTFFRVRNTMEHAEEFDGSKFSQAMFIRYQISNNRGIGTECLASGDTSPILQYEKYKISVTYRRRIYKTWAFFSIQPIAEYARENNFEFDPRLRFELELYFGRIAVF